MSAGTKLALLQRFKADPAFRAELRGDVRNALRRAGVPAGAAVFGTLIASYLLTDERLLALTAKPLLWQ